MSYCSNLINAKELLDAKRCEENGRVEDYLKRCTDSGFSRKLDLWDFLGLNFCVYSNFSIDDFESSRSTTKSSYEISHSIQTYS